MTTFHKYSSTFQRETESVFIQQPNFVLPQREHFDFLKRMPYFELSYEKISHRKVFANDFSQVLSLSVQPPVQPLNKSPVQPLNKPMKTNQDNKLQPFVEIHIPFGKKYLLWFSYSTTLNGISNKTICYLLEIDCHQQICNIEIVNSFLFPPHFSKGTLLYGCIPNKTNHFIIEDIFYYNGVCMKDLYLGQKLGVYERILCEMKEYLDYHETVEPHSYVCSKNQFTNKYTLFLPFMKQFQYLQIKTAAGAVLEKQMSHDIHHVNIIHLTNPLLHFQLCSYQCPHCKTFTFSSVITTTGNKKQEHFSGAIKKGQIGRKIFMVSADMQYDIYHLYSPKKELQVNQPIVSYPTKDECRYYDVANVPTIKTSVFLNSIFRTIRENQNIDYIEESDDEDNFEDMKPDKYVDLEKFVMMECEYSHSFKKWIPVKVV